MSEFSGYLSLAVTCAGFIAVIWQIVAARRQRVRDMQPRIFVRLRKIKSGANTALAISIMNAGQSPALDVCVDFGAVQKWHYVKVVSFPFLETNGGIRNLPPGTENTYRLGLLDRNLNHWLTSEAKVTVRYKDSQSRDFSSFQVLTLKDSIYLMEKQ